MVKDPRADPGEDSGTAASVSASLLDRLRGQEPDAWRRLTELYEPLVHAWCRRAGLSEADAADIGQEVFQAVYRHLSGFHRDRPGDTFRGWLWTVTRNKLRDQARRRQGRPADAAGGTTAQERLLNVPEAADDSSAEAGRDEDRRSLFRRGLELIRTEFEERTWQAFWRVTVDGQAPAEVASDLGMSPGAVYVAKSRILRRLREELGELLD